MNLSNAQEPVSESKLGNLFFNHLTLNTCARIHSNWTQVSRKTVRKDVN